ncbi:hypothetical protein [Streptococcus equinus]|uniref:hypothetical protein n=1 Tax=Streptococcus equinus TaxID=1335 RepID=UPI00051B35C6|nr:hypothetical protein [Streptococcus equinus]
MKKKLLATFLAVMSVFLLVACSSNDDLSGKWYGVDYKGKKVLVLDINGGSGTLDFENKVSITNVDTKHKTFSFADGKEYTVSYTIDDDVLTVNYGSYIFSGSTEYKYYRENSEALKKAIEKQKNK